MVTLHPAASGGTHPRISGWLGLSEPTPRVRTLVERLAAARAGSIGFPAARDIDYTPVLPLHSGLINNLGDPETSGPWPGHTHDIEREIVRLFIGLFGGTPESCWGYVSGGGSSEGVLHGLWLARERFPAARLYYSAAAHYCVPKAAHLLGMDSSVIPVDKRGAIDLSALAAAVAEHPRRPVVAVATLGTTMTEALDDIPAIHAVLNAAGIVGRHVVVDAALSGPSLAVEGGPAAGLLTEEDRTGDAGGGADSVCFSTHKALGTPHVGGIVLTRRDHVDRVARHVDYVGTRDMTIGGSRPGQTAVEVAHALHTIGGPAQLHARAQAARDVAAYAVMALTAAGWPAWRHEHAWTVVLDPPPEQVRQRWGVPVSDRRAHIICAPGVTRADVDAFIADLAVADRVPSLPAQRAAETAPTTQERAS